MQWVIWAVAMSVVMGLLAKGRDRVSSKNGHVLNFPTSVLVVGLGCGAFFAVLAVVSGFFPGRQKPPIAVPLLFAGFAICGAGVLVDGLRTRHEWSPDGVEYRSFIHSGHYTWNEIRRVGHSMGMKWFVVDLADGRRVRMSFLLAGLPSWAREVLRQLPERVDQDTRELLEHTRDGRPPAVWN
jgi:hypothetical protein